MKKLCISSILIISAVFFSLFHVYGGDSQHEIISANFLVEKGVIQPQSSSEQYKLSKTITRREMLKVMMNISGKEVSETCTGDFTDMKTGDWGCKYAEAALNQGYIAANTKFRPDDSVTKIEALKMIMQAKEVARDQASDWRVGYVSKAESEGILENSFTDYNTVSLRSWIFVTAARTYEDTPDFPEIESEQGLTPEEEELLNHFLNI